MTYYGAKELAESFRTVRKTTIQVAADMPSDKYSLQAASDVRTVEKLFTHIALSCRWQLAIHNTGRTSVEGFDFQPLMQEMMAEEGKPRTKAEVIELLRT